MAHPLSRRSWLTAAAATAARPQSSAPGAQPLLRLPKRIRIALLGVEGHAGEILKPLDRLPDVELVAIYDPDPKAIAGIIARNPRAAGARPYSDWREMLDREKLDLVGIAGSNAERAPAILACAGRKLNIVAEKPLAIEMADLQEIEKAVAQYGVRLTMLLPMRFSAPYLAMKQIVASGEIGEVAQIGAQKSYKLGPRAEWMRHRNTFGGTIPYIGVHMVDLMRWASGRELVEASSFQSRIGYPEMLDMENTTATLFRLDNGGVATLRMDYLRPMSAPTHGDDRLRIAGAKGIVEHTAEEGLTLITKDQKPHRITDLPPSRSLFADFLSSVYLSTPSGLELHEVYRVNRIVLLAREAAERHQIVTI